MPHASCVPAVHAKAYFDSERTGCTCDHPCRVDAMFHLSPRFAHNDKSNKTHAVTSMMLPLTFPVKNNNFFSARDPRRALIRKRKLKQPNSREHSHTVYAVKGYHIFRHFLAAVGLLNLSSENKYAQLIVNGRTVALYDAAISNRRKI